MSVVDFVAERILGPRDEFHVLTEPSDKLAQKIGLVEVIGDGQFLITEREFGRLEARYKHKSKPYDHVPQTDGQVLISVKKKVANTG